MVRASKVPCPFNDLFLSNLKSLNLGSNKDVQKPYVPTPHDSLPTWSKGQADGEENVQRRPGQSPFIAGVHRDVAITYDRAIGLTGPALVVEEKYLQVLTSWLNYLQL